MLWHQYDIMTTDVVKDGAFRIIHLFRGTVWRLLKDSFNIWKNCIGSLCVGSNMEDPVFSPLYWCLGFKILI